MMMPAGWYFALTCRSFERDCCVELRQHTGVVRCFWALAAGLKVAIDLFRVQLLAAFSGHAAQAS
jgi:hypothetical protein